MVMGLEWVPAVARWVAGLAATSGGERVGFARSRPLLLRLRRGAG